MLPNLTNDATTVFFFSKDVEPLVSDFVLAVDGGDGVGLEGASMTRPDAFWGGRVYVEFKSARVFFHHVTEILDIAKANDGKGSTLELGAHETNGRSIIFKVFLHISWFLLSRLLNDSTH
jgi:hypothetical protein